MHYYSNNGLHGGDVKRLLWVLVALYALVLSKGIHAAERNEADPDYQALTILTRNCASCHNQADHPGALFLNQARLSEPETLALITRLIEKNVMPPAHAKFKNTADGKTLLKWLKNKQKGEKK